MKDSEKDKFEQFFQNSLEHYEEQPANGGWEEMRHKIPPPPVAATSFWKSNRSWLGLLLLSSVLVLLGFIFWENNLKLNEIKESVHLHSEKINDIENEIQQKLNPENEISLEKNKNIIVEKVENNKVDEKLMNAISSKKQNIYKSEKQDFISQNNKGNKSTEFYNSSAEQVGKTFTNENIVSNNETLEKNNTLTFSKKGNGIVNATENNSNNLISQKRNLETIDSIESLFSEVKLFPKKNDEEFTIIGLPKGLPNRGFELFGNFSKIIPSQKILNSGVGFQSNKNYNVDIGVLYHIPFHQKWSLQLGFGMGSTVNSSLIQKSFEYSPNEVTLADNFLRTSYYYQWETNYDGKIGLTTYFDNRKLNDGQDVLPGDNFSTEIILSRKQEYFVVPLLLKYAHGNKYQSVRWTIRTGIFERFYFKKNAYELVEMKNTTSSRLSHYQTQLETLGGNKSNKRIGMEAVLGVGVEYAPHQNFTLILEPIYKKSITRQGQIAPATFGVYAGLRLNFVGK